MNHHGDHGDHEITKGAKEQRQSRISKNVIPNMPQGSISAKDTPALNPLDDKEIYSFTTIYPPPRQVVAPSSPTHSMLFPSASTRNGTYVVGFGREAAGLVDATSRSGNSLVGSLLWFSGFWEVEGSSREKSCLEAFRLGWRYRGLGDGVGEDGSLFEVLEGMFWLL